MKSIVYWIFILGTRNETPFNLTNRHIIQTL